MSNSQVDITPQELGKIPSAYGGPSNFHGVFIQIAHQGQEPKSSEPGFRILRFCQSDADRKKSLKTFAKRGLSSTGNILYHVHNSTTLICKNLVRQVNPEHVNRKSHDLKLQCIEFAHFRNEDYLANRIARRAGNQEEARKRQDAFIAKYNERGWVKMMRQRLQIDPSVRVVPGMHNEAEEESKKMRVAEAKSTETSGASAPSDSAASESETVRKTIAEAVKNIKPPQALAAPEPAKDENDEDESDDDDEEFDRAHALPDGVKRRGEIYAAVSFIVEDEDDLETLLFIHGFYATSEAATEHISSDLNTAMYPMDVHVVTVGEWIQPIQMLWNDSALSKRVEGLTETNAMIMAQRTQEDRAEAIKRSRHLKGEVERKKKKAMDAGVAQGLCERLKINERQLAGIVDDKDHGTDAVIALCNEKDEEKRAARVHDILLSLGLLEASDKAVEATDALVEATDALAKATVETTEATANVFDVHNVEETLALQPE